MALREHSSGDVRIKIATVHTDVAGQFIEWGAEAWRERKRAVSAVWWNPFSWGGYEWRREGTPPISEVKFFRADGNVIAESVLNPSLIDQPGYRKLSCVYTFVSTGTGSGLTNLGNDARAVSNVSVTYTWNNTSHTFSDH